MPNKELVSVQEEDFLDQDPPLRGQNYVCLSFVSPEEVLKRKDVFFFEQFLKGFSVDMHDFFQKLSEKYPDESGLVTTIKERYRYIFDVDKIQDEYSYFVANHGSSLESEFHEKNNFLTSIRGIKVRGVFDTIREAEVRAQVLKRLDDKFHVYVAQVGCWCPWSPNPDEIAEQEYAETHLNSLMKKYKENQDKKDIFFEERKRDLQFMKTKSKLEEKDPWLNKIENEVVPNQNSESLTAPAEENVDGGQEPVQEPVVDAGQELVQEPVVDAGQEPVQEPVVDAGQELVQEPVVDGGQEPVQEAA